MLDAMPIPAKIQEYPHESKSRGRSHCQLKITGYKRDVTFGEGYSRRNLPFLILYSDQVSESRPFKGSIISPTLPFTGIVKAKKAAHSVRVSTRAAKAVEHDISGTAEAEQPGRFRTDRILQAS